VTASVVIDITRLLGRYLAGRYPTGVDRVSLAYIAHYAPNARGILRWKGRSAVFSKRISAQVFAYLLLWNFSQIKFMQWWTVCGVWSSLVAGNTDGTVLLFTGHNDAESDSLWRSIYWHRLRPVFFVHDLIPLSHPQFCRKGESEKHAQRMDRMLQGAAVIANSESTLQELAKYASASKQVMPMNTAAFLAPPAQFVTKLAALNQKSNSHIGRDSFGMLSRSTYFVVLGTIEPRKNHALLLRVWREFLSQGPLDAVPHLWVVGQSGWKCEDLERQMRATDLWHGRLHWIERCNDEDLLALLSGARALLFPSHVEGFGIPLVEALMVGTPVIANNLAVFKEFAGDVPDYLPPDDDLAWAEAVRSYALADSPQHDAQCRRMQAWQAPTWQGHFQQVDALLETMSVAASSETVARLKSARIPSEKIGIEQHFSWRKRRILYRYLKAMGLEALPQASFRWGAADLPNGMVQVEDGFIRSVGLGADLIAPLSWVFDTRGMYFDATRASDLEHLLQHQNYTDSQLQRAESLRKAVVLSGATKYNLHAPAWVRPPSQPYVILVVGQVESDASIRLGAHRTCTNQQLLQLVRQANPQAYIVYKPHPDVVAGLRSGGNFEPPLANEVLLAADMAQLLTAVDAVHVMTSLAGFEALLRGVPVTTYGAPFYAGWGLTKDMDLPEAVKQRRTRRLDLNHLVAATLIDYPVYLHPENNHLITPEQALRVVQAQRLRAQEQVKNLWLTRLRRGILRAVAKIRKRY
jgi:glycosyltransferase involved in cell wall biosynthesis